ncbi:MAG: transposase [Oscillatoria princeps RMCB-10]|nr:transposase [Oscillatoria princeps RMCB-10]
MSAYYMRQKFFDKGRHLSDRLTLKELYAVLKRTEAYKAEPPKVSNQIIKQVIHDWSACQEATLAYLDDSSEFKGQPQIPKYKPKNCGRNVLVCDNQSIGQRGKNKNNGLLRLSQTNIAVQTRTLDVVEVRAVPRVASYVIEVVCEKPVSFAQLNPQLVAGINFGIDNLAALGSNKPGFVPTLVDGERLKSINQGYNKKVACLKSKLQGISQTSKRRQQITFKRNKQVEDYLHKASRFIVDRSVGSATGQLVIGKNPDWKQEVELGKNPNQTFVYIPHAGLIEMITYKAELPGIKVVVTDDYYTSKTSFLDLCWREKREYYQGKKVKRGLFRASNGALINADVSGAFNRIQKVSGNEPFNEVTLRVGGVCSFTCTGKVTCEKRKVRQWKALSSFLLAGSASYDSF